jgi:Protochlamydia outer membrane protein
MDLVVRRWGVRCSFFLVGLFILGFGTSPAQATVQPQNPGQAQAVGTASPFSSSSIKKTFGILETEFSLGVGMRKDDLSWSIAGTSAGSNPNVLSELEWSAVESRQVKLANRSLFHHRIYARGALDYAWVQDGSLRDSDYDGDNHAQEWSRSISASNGDELWDVSGGAGYAFVWKNDRLLVAPLLGVSYHRQNLRITDGAQVVSGRPPAPAVGALSNKLNSTYFARWVGPWMGCDLRYKTPMRGPDLLSMTFGLSVELHYADYYGEGNWNLRSDLAHPKSFEHEAKGYGICLTGQWLIALTDHWDWLFTVNIQHWSTDSGTDRKFVKDGGTVTTRLNGVDWDSSSFTLGVAYHF